MALTNNLETFRSEGIHFISVILIAKEFEGTPTILEPAKCEELLWVDPSQLPTPHFDASRLAVDCYLNNQFYMGISK